MASDGEHRGPELIDPLRGKRVLVTGGSGFIGSHVVAALVARDAEVTVVDRRPAPAGVAVVLGDLTEQRVVDAALDDGTHAVVHLAAVTSVLGSLARPRETYRTNVGVTAALLERARHTGTSCLVLASTNAVVGDAVSSGRLDERSPMRPLTPYGASKAAAEMLVCASSAAYAVRGISLRFTNVYGSGMVAKDSIVARIMRAAESGSTMAVYGAGHQVRDYLYVADAVAAILLALSSMVSGPVVIGSGTSTSVLDLLAVARSATGSALPARHVPAPPGEMAAVMVDVTRAATDLGWAHEVEVAEGISTVWEAWRGESLERLPAPIRARRRAWRG